MKKICLIGSNISNSKSPNIHKFISEYFNLSYTYTLELCEKIDFEYLKNNYDGFNVTMPFKNEICKYLDNYSFNSINTVKFENGKSFGISTDGDGFCRSFQETFLTDFNNKKIVILGFGGAGQSIYEAIKKQNPKKISILSRQKKYYDYKMQKHVLCDAEVVINTTNCYYSLVEKKYINNSMYLCDVNYKNPSELLSFGTKTMNGFGMLFFQAVKACEFWFDTKLELKKSWKELEKELMK